MSCLSPRQAKISRQAEKIQMDTSGIDVPVSNASFENFERQIKDAVQFLTDSKTESRKRMNCKDGDDSLDFATNCFIMCQVL
jgi:hypothetical protein